jgi:hypothetical protein
MTYGILVLIAFLTRSQWLLLVVGILMIIRIFSVKFDIPYQLHSLFLRKALKQKAVPSQKEEAELNFVSGMTGILIIIGFLFIYFNKFVDIAWVYILVVDLLIFLACFVGFCIATLMYILLKKILKK